MSFQDRLGMGPAFFSRPWRGRATAKKAAIVVRAPRHANWITIRPRAARAIRAWRAERDGQIASRDGVLSYKSGRDWIVEHGDRDYAVVRAADFERTYRRAAEGGYERRGDVPLRYFTLPDPSRVRTRDGIRDAAAGDWIIEGVSGELWPVRANLARDYFVTG